MRLIDKIKIIPRNKIIDNRGWFLKVIDGKEENLPQHTGEIYLIQAKPGETRANHYHNEASEWFTLIQGKADMHLEDIETGESLEIALNSDTPFTIFVPALIAHSFENASNEPYVLVAYANRMYDPEDTVGYTL
jgi:dTDP-4-dehydrorhamnose 3,5-epimerase-like enzyme